MGKHSEFYDKYIRSPEWRQKEQERMAFDGYRCVMCHKPAKACKRQPLQCHHVTYERLGHENVYWDLVTLCGTCHKRLHNYLARNNRNNRNSA